MCGIIGVISKTEDCVITQTMDGLYQIQNRGYDSVGLCYSIDNEFNCYKYAGEDCFDNLQLDADKIVNLSNEKINASCIIAHTRWATHGGKTKTNAHPHISMNSTFALVHNGIIDNFSVLKKTLLKNKYIFKSATDSEVIVNLIDYYLQLYLTSADMIDSNNVVLNSGAITYKLISNIIKQVCEVLTGTYALLIECIYTPGHLYVIRKGSPIVVGENNDNIFIASEQSGFNGKVNTYFKLINSTLLVINKQGIINKDELSQNDTNIIKINDENSLINHKIYKYWTIQEIIEQKLSLNTATNNGGRILNNKKEFSIKLGGLIDYFKTQDINSVSRAILIGCGTSLFACNIAKKYFLDFRIFNAIDVYDGSELTDNHIYNPLDSSNDKTVVILCSQSGETKDVYQCLQMAKKFNCITVGIVNVVDSLISTETDCGIYLNAGRETAVASTKSFTSMIVVLSLLAIWFYQEKTKTIIVDNFVEKGGLRNEYIISLDKTIKNISKQIDSIKNNSKEFLLVETKKREPVEIKGENFAKIIDALDTDNIFVLGSGKMEYLAKEICLKMKEICYIHAEGYNSNSLKHGPFALLKKNFVVLLIIDADNIDTSIGIYQEIISREARCLILTAANDLEKYSEINSDDVIMCDYSQHYQELSYIVKMQYIIFLLSIRRGINPDKPRNLAKVVTV